MHKDERKESPMEGTKGVSSREYQTTKPGKKEISAALVRSRRGGREQRERAF